MPANPTKAEDETYTYEFVGWTPELEETVKGNAEYTATYIEKYKEYTVTFKNEDGSVITSKAYHYGETVDVPENSTKPEDETYTYEFAGWTPEVEETVTANAEYMATYTEKYKEYTVTFKNEDGSVIASKIYHYGETVEVPENPTKPEDETYTYEFAGWDKEITTVKGNTEYTATYINRYKEYTVVFKQDNGNIINSTVYHYGDKVNLPEEPVKESTIEYVYTFAGWTPKVAETVTGNAEYTATYTEEKVKYSIIFYNDDGVTEVSKIEDYTWGDSFVFPAAPTKAPTEEIYYVFTAWNNLGVEEITSTEKRIKLVAEYREEYFVARVEATESLEGVSYLSLEEAIENAGSEERTIRVLRDTQESVMIEDNQNITLNLNGKTITGTKNYAIKNYGTLIVTDETEEKSGKITDIVSSEIGYGIHNRDGKVTIKGGTIVTETSQESGATYGIYNQSEETLVIEGGSVIAEAKGKASISAGIYNLAGKEIEVTGGIVLGNALAESSTGYGIYNETEGKINVTNGRVEAKTALASGISYGIYNKTSQEVTISGGTIAAQSDKNMAYGVYNKEGKVTVTGGTIEITAATGYGIYNETGTVDIEAGKIITVGTNSYGIYNNAGTIDVSGVNIELTSSKSYGIYNKSQMNITGGEITSKSSGSSTYGIFNNLGEYLSIKNIKIADLYYGIYNYTGKLEIKNSIIEASTGIYNSGSSANTIVNSVEIEAKSTGIENQQGKVVVESSNIVSDLIGVAIEYGEVILQSANITSNRYGVYNNSTGNIEIGIKDKNISTEQPNIYGKTNAIYNDVTSSGQVKFYDGILTGETVIYGGINEIEDNSEIVVTTNEEGNEVATLQKIEEVVVAKIGDNTYTSLSSAVEAVAENATESTTIQIVSDFEISKAVEIPQNKNITIDLAGHTVTTYAKGGMINKGTLEITDSTEEKVGKILSEIGMGISNYGDLTLTSGIIESDEYGICNYKNAIVVVQGGEIHGESYGIYDKGVKASVNIKGGVISSNYTGICNGSGSIVVEDGKVLSKTCGIYNNSGEIIIKGGEISSDSKGIENNNGIISVQNGTIKGKGYGIYNSETANIIGGKIEGNTGIYNSGSKLSIGEKDNNVNTKSPTIIGGSCGIENHQYMSELGYYDGTVFGKEPFKGNIYELEEGKEIQISIEKINEVEYKVANLVNEKVYEDGIAQIEDTIYKTPSSLKQAISKIPTKTEESVQITILDNFEITQIIKISSNQNIKINLNGKTITTKSSIINEGKLEITDETESHRGTIINVGTGFGIINSANTEGLKITKGTIEAKGSFGIFSYSNVVIGTNDGKVDDTAVVIKGEHQGISKYHNNNIIEMYDGVIKGTYSGAHLINKTEEGYKVYVYTEGIYNVAALQLESPIARTGGVDYGNLQEAIDKCENDGTIEILRNVDNIKNTITIAEGKNIVLDLKGYTISSNVEKFFVNNGTLTISTSSGAVENTKSNGITVENNGELNLLKGKIRNNYGTAVENNGTLNVAGGEIYGNSYGINNKENSTLVINSGFIRANKYTIYNDSTNIINMTGGSIAIEGASSGSLYGIYNNVKADINMTGGRIYNIYSASGAYGYGIYNNENGNILISKSNEITINNFAYAYGIYNNGEGNVTLDKGNISVSGGYLAYGIKNTSKGKVQVTEGSIKATSSSGYAYGIENGSFGNVEIAKGSITAETDTGTAYGIKNMSVSPLTIKQATIKATGAQSYGIHNNTSDLVIGENNGTVTAQSPIIESDYIGIYISTVGLFNFYDGQVIGGEQSTNVDANVPEGYRLLKYYDKEKQKEIATISNSDNYVLTYYLNGEKYESIILKSGSKIPENKIDEEGYEFSGWQDLPTTMPAEDINIYANLIPKTYTITYYVDGVQYGEIETYEYKSEITPREMPVKEGREFSGWQDLPETMPAQNIEVRGVFTYTATFYNEDKTSVIATVPFTTNDTSIQEPEIPNKEGHIGWWTDYEIKAEDLDIQLVYVEENAVINKTKVMSYGNVETAVADVDTNGVQNEIFLTENMTSEATIIVLQNANVILDLNGYTITNNSVYCGIDNYGTLTIEDNSEANTGAITVEKPDTNVYGIYNRENANVTIKTGKINVSSSSTTTSETYEGTGIYNSSNAIITLGIKDGVVNNTNPRIQGTRYGINNVNGTINFYDGEVLGTTSIEGDVSESEVGYRTETSVDSETNLQISYLNNIPNGTQLTATDENGITWNYTYQDRQATYVYYNSGTLPQEVTIPATLNGHKVVSLYNSSGYNRNIFTSTNYGTNSSVRKVIIPEGVMNIVSRAFYNCTGLKEILIPDSVTTIGSDAFNNTTWYNNQPDGVVYAGKVLYDYKGIMPSDTKIDILDGTKSISGDAFNGDTGLTEITIPESVTSIGSLAFYDCTGLKEVVIPNSVTSIGSYAFGYCIGLTNISIPDSVTSIDYGAFVSCEGLTQITIPDNVTRIDGLAFADCSSLTSIEVPGSVTDIGDLAFTGCNSLTIIKMSEGVTSIGEDAFRSCTSLTDLVIPNSVTSIGSYAFGNCIGLKEITISNSLASIGYGTFSECTGLIEITIPDSVTSIGYYAFWKCTGLTEIVMSESVAIIESGAFDDTAWYNNQPDGVVYAGKVLYDYKGTMPYDTRIEILDGTKSISGNAFYGCTGLKEITIPNSVTSIGSSAFEGCTGLTEIVMSESVAIIESGAFDDTAWYNNQPDGVVYAGKVLYRYKGTMPSDTKIDILDGTKSISGNAFYGCTGLTEITIPNSVTSIGDSAFFNWTNSQTINIEANEVPGGWHEDWDYKCNAKIVFGYTGE